MTNEQQETFQIMLENELRSILNKICEENIGTPLEIMLCSLIIKTIEDFNTTTKGKYNQLMDNLKKVDANFTMFHTQWANIVDAATDKVQSEYIES